MTDDDVDAAVLLVLAGQSSGYVCGSAASAFVAYGLTLPEATADEPNPLTADVVAASCARLVTSGDAEQVDGTGWIITDAGRAAG